MTELWLKFKDENGDPRKVPVRGEKFTIGRHSENDLCIPRNQLSRRHAEIDRFENVYVISDNNSSNGTTLNGTNLERPTALGDGDRINLGGGIEIEVELASGFGEAQNVPKQPDASEIAEKESVEQAEIAAEVSAKDFVPAITEPPAPQVSAPQVSAAAPKSPLKSCLMIASVLSVFLLISGCGLLWFFSGKPPVAKNNYPDYSDDDDKPSKNKKGSDSKESPTPSPKTSSSDPSNSPSPSATSNSQSGPTPQISGEADKIERNAYAFLRRIAKADQSPYLTTQQIALVNAKINSLKNSSALRGNLQDLKKKSAEIDSLAKSKALRPQFLAAAALARLGNTRGDPLATAQSMAGALNMLSNQISNDLSSDSLMIIAAYQEDPSGSSRMPSMLGSLTQKYPNESAQKIRTIWFLHENKKISDPQFDFAVTFLAIGAITQNPRDFNVDSEAVVFN